MSDKSSVSKYLENMLVNVITGIVEDNIEEQVSKQIERQDSYLIDVKQVIVMRTDLNMRKGKMIAQGSHASNMFLFDCMNTMQEYEHLSNSRTPQRAEYMISLLNSWIGNKYKKIVVSVNSLEELESLIEQAKKLAILTYKVTDSGLTEFHGQPTITCASFGPVASKIIDQVTGELKLL